jgi:hypothetical protein
MSNNAKLKKQSLPARSLGLLGSLLVLLGIAFLVICLGFSSQLSSLSSSESQTEPLLRTSVTHDLAVGTAHGIAYYHCRATATTSTGNLLLDIILLHGSRFTKEDWKTSGILAEFCASPDVSVTALDLDIRATHSELEAVLTYLADKEQAIHLPVATIVTPSASGFTMIGSPPVLPNVTTLLRIF